MADDAVLTVETLAHDFGIRRCCGYGSASGPVHGIALIDILTETATVKGEVESSPEQAKDKETNQPG
jgi:hypothetical protein